jgi:2-polyprenyl-3-methyl-5-hydroxy-6-metoxy-1,4-benzoquinol methylase
MRQAKESVRQPKEFDRFADDYEKILNESVAASGEDSMYFAEYKSAYLRRMLPRGFAGRVLDFGCGVGMLSGVLQQQMPGAQIDGFDISQDSIDRVPAAVSSRGVFTADLAALSHAYDLIVIANVLHHIRPGSRPEVFADLTSRLATGGSIVVFEHNPANPVTRRIVERCPFDDDALLLPLAETCRYARAAGLAVDRRDYIVFMPRALAWLRPLEPWMAWLPAGAQYAMAARKAA